MLVGERVVHGIHRNLAFACVVRAFFRELPGRVRVIQHDKAIAVKVGPPVALQPGKVSVNLVSEKRAVLSGIADADIGHGACIPVIKPDKIHRRDAEDAKKTKKITTETQRTQSGK
jgi:hypothetical protein